MLDEKDFIYVNEPDKARGFNGEVIFLENWDENNKWDYNYMNWVTQMLKHGRFKKDKFEYKKGDCRGQTNNKS